MNPLLSPRHAALLIGSAAYGRGPTVLTPRKSSRTLDGISLNSLSARASEAAGLITRPTDKFVRDWDPALAVNDRGGMEPGVVYALNTDMAAQYTYSQPLTTYATGWAASNTLKAACDFLAPEVPTTWRFEYKQWTNPEYFLSDDANDDLRGIEGDFKTIQMTASDVFARTQIHGLRTVIDLREVRDDPNWRYRLTENLTDRLNRNRYRNAVTLAAGGAVQTAVSWQPQNNVLPIVISGTSGQAQFTVTSAAGLLQGMTVAGVGIPVGTVIVTISGTTVFISAALTTSPSSENAIAFVPVNPDSQVRVELGNAGDVSGLRPNRVLYGLKAWDARTNTLEAILTAGSISGAVRTPESLRAYLQVDDVKVSDERYQSSYTGKSQIVGDNVFMFTALQNPTREDPSNIKCFISESEGGGYLRVYERIISDTMVEIIVSREELLTLVTTLGLRQFTVTG